ncbi:MAG: AAA family ATPase [Blastocatellia bacterium]|nr:AAA family ATPase [Blastocatellia bacterium]
MITKIELTNFKSHAHTVIEPRRVTALVGPNGAGKSNVLQALRSLMDLAVPRPNLELNPSGKLMREGCDSFEIKVEGKHQKHPWLFKALTSSRDYPLPHAPHTPNVRAWGMYIEGRLFHEEGYLAPPENRNVSLLLGTGIPESLLAAVGKYTYLKATAANLASPSYTEEIPPSISADGQGMASTIANLMTSETDGHQAIVESLHQIVSLVKNVRVRPARIARTEKRVISIDGKDFPFDEKREVVGHEIIFDTQTIKGLPAYAMSDGTLLALGLLTLLWSSPNAHLILLDDIEAGLHPLAQRQLMKVIKDFAEKHDRQIILTSHSPYIVDALDAKDVWVMATDKEGISHTKRLSDHPDATRALDILTTGELWDAEGESWVLENAPAELANA